MKAQSLIPRKGITPSCCIERDKHELLANSQTFNLGVNTISTDEQDYKIWYYFVGDQTFLALVTGIDSATSQYGVNPQWMSIYHLGHEAPIYWRTRCNMQYIAAGEITL